MKLFYSPGACSIGIHVVLEEIGATYELERVAVQEPPASRPLTAINPKSKVPTLLRDDGSVLTEYAAIGTWLALTHGASHLVPSDAEHQARSLEAMDYVVATMHMQGYTRIARPGRFAPSEADFEAVKEQGRAIFAAGFEVMETALGDHDWLAGDFSIADTALFYVEFWAAIRQKMTLPPACAAHFARMRARPAVARVLEKEGFGS